MKYNKENGFTLAEVLITLAIIGVVAAIAIPSVISNSQQQEFKTGLRKAVSVLNSAITINMALDGESPYDNANLFGFLMKHMAIIESTTYLGGKYTIKSGDVNSNTGALGTANNYAFYTTDGTRFEFMYGGWGTHKHYLYENQNVKLCTPTAIVGTRTFNGWYGEQTDEGCNGCGSYGLNSNSDNTTKPPCMIMVDVNGDKKPNPANVNCKDSNCAKAYKYSDAKGIKLMDLFTIMITDKSAIPYGVAAQRAMYQAQK